VNPVRRRRFDLARLLFDEPANRAAEAGKAGPLQVLERMWRKSWKTVFLGSHNFGVELLAQLVDSIWQRHITPVSQEFGMHYWSPNFPSLLCSSSGLASVTALEARISVFSS
jgi:hypothetical protein